MRSALRWVLHQPARDLPIDADDHLVQILRVGLGQPETGEEDLGLIDNAEMPDVKIPGSDLSYEPGDVFLLAHRGGIVAEVCRLLSAKRDLGLPFFFGEARPLSIVVLRPR